MPALSFRLLATCITACSALSTPAQSLDRTTNIEWQTFVVQEFGTRVQYPANIFVPAGRPGKGIGQKFKSADGRAELSIYSIQNEAGETPATYLRRNLRMDRSALYYTRIASMTNPARNGRYAAANAPAVASRTAWPLPSSTRQTTTPPTVSMNETNSASGPACTRRRGCRSRRRAAAAAAGGCRGA